jgi:hypothetical protein
MNTYSLPDPQRGVSPWRESKRTLALQDQPGNPAKLVFFKIKETLTVGFLFVLKWVLQFI